MDFGDGKWSVRKKRLLRMVCLFETVFLTLGGKSLASIYFSVTSWVPYSPPSILVGVHQVALTMCRTAEFDMHDTALSEDVVEFSANAS